MVPDPRLFHIGGRRIGHRQEFPRFSALPEYSLRQDHPQLSVETGIEYPPGHGGFGLAGQRDQPEEGIRRLKGLPSGTGPTGFGDPQRQGIRDCTVWMS